MSKDRGKKWDGKSRVSNDLYRKRYNEMTKEKAIDETVPVNEDEEYLKELKDKL